VVTASIMANVSARPKLAAAKAEPSWLAVPRSLAAALIADPRSRASAAWKARLSASRRPDRPGAAARAAATSMIIFSSLKAGIPDGIGRPGIGQGGRAEIGVVGNAAVAGMAIEEVEFGEDAFLPDRCVRIERQRAFERDRLADRPHLHIAGAALAAGHSRHPRHDAAGAS
jgi:hypothetical protein